MILLERERLLSELEQKIGYSFRSRALLDRALTHRSFANERTDEHCQHNEAMEFLGDSVLGFVVSAWLLERFPDLSEGKLSKMKAFMVSESSLVELAEEIDLGRYILLNRGEEKTGGRRKHALLADAYEALIGVLYVDGGTGVAERFLRRELGEKLTSIDPASMIGADYKSALQERLQAAGGTVPEYAVVEVTGPDHRRTFRVELRVAGQTLAAGEGHTIKIAQQEAARAGLESDALPGVVEALKQNQKRDVEADGQRAANGTNSGSREDALTLEGETQLPTASAGTQSQGDTGTHSQARVAASASAVDASIEAGDDGRLSADADSEIVVTEF
ncbi:MAG: ribonuclease III [Acidobacteriota bacterium]